MSERDMDPSRLSALLDAYGGDPEHWPAEERASAERLIAGGEAAQRLSREALALDAVLSSAPSLEPSADLRRSVAEIPLRHPRTAAEPEGWRALLPFHSPWRTALAGAFALLLGVAGGLATSEPPAVGVAAGASPDVAPEQAPLEAEWAELEALAFAEPLDQEALP